MVAEAMRILGTSRPTEFEMIHPARDGSEATRISTRLHAFDYLRTDDDIFIRALEIQRHALNACSHRALSLPDLLVAATAEPNRRTVLHCDGCCDSLAGWPHIRPPLPGARMRPLDGQVHRL